MIFHKTYEEARKNHKPMKRGEISRPSFEEARQAADRRHAEARITMATGKFRSAQRRMIKKNGPKTSEWDRARRWLKIQFEKVGIHTCQLRLAGCAFDNYLGFAHPAKRRNLLEGEIYVVALLCNNCHDIIEVGPAEDMRRIVEKLFALTGIQIPKGTP